MSRIYEIFGTDAHEMTLSLLRAANVKSMIPPGASVALKPNLVLASPPENGATTHPGVLSGCIEYLRENGVADISIIESSWIGAKTEPSMRAAGYDKVCEKYGVPFYDLKRTRPGRCRLPCGPWRSPAGPWTRTSSSTCRC